MSPLRHLLIQPRHGTQWGAAWHTGQLVANHAAYTLSQQLAAERAQQYELHRLRFTEERARQADLLREIFFQPFRRVILYRSWFRWNDGTIPHMAQALYDDRRFEEMPLLADALEEAGCTDSDILSHCRGPGPHVRGCWVIDLLLGKE
ncbi:MAG: hypothetical protein L0Z62_06140 [Gemmataceae bacterium]|nr:hypothetical protein [Gemmataceae bacterium]